MSGEWTPGPAWLFCPGDRADRYLKALSAADVVIVDLEDAVAPAQRSPSRASLRRLAAEGIIDTERTVLRVNAAGTDDHGLDLELAAVLDLPRVMLAKSESSATVSSIQHEVVLLLETPLGIERAGELAAVPNVGGVMWGADDLVAGLGARRAAMSRAIALVSTVTSRDSPAPAP